MILNNDQLAMIAEYNQRLDSFQAFPLVTDMYNPKSQIIHWLLETIVAALKEKEGSLEYADNPALLENKPNKTKHEEYLVIFARNHGLSISEAREAPMVKAHEEYCNAIQYSPGDMNHLSKTLHDRFENGYLRSATD
jgi:hypothetical protein